MLKISEPDPRVTNYRQTSSHFLAIPPATWTDRLLEWHKQWCPTALAELEHQKPVGMSLTDHLAEQLAELAETIRQDHQKWTSKLVNKIPDGLTPDRLREAVKLAVLEADQMVTVKWMPKREVKMSAWPKELGAEHLLEHQIQVTHSPITPKTPQQWGQIVFQTVTEATSLTQNLEPLTGEAVTVKILQQTLDRMNPLEHHRIMTEASLIATTKTRHNRHLRHQAQELMNYPHATYPTRQTQKPSQNQKPR